MPTPQHLRPRPCNASTEPLVAARRATVPALESNSFPPGNQRQGLLVQEVLAGSGSQELHKLNPFAVFHDIFSSRSQASSQKPSSRTNCQNGPAFWVLILVDFRSRTGRPSFCFTRLQNHSAVLEQALIYAGMPRVALNALISFWQPELVYCTQLLQLPHPATCHALSGTRKTSSSAPKMGSKQGESN